MPGPRSCRTGGSSRTCAGQADVGEANLSIAAVRINCQREAKPLLDRALAEQVGALQARLRNDPFIEQAARREWAKMCRSIPLGKAAAGVPDLWLEVRPVRAVAAQPKIDASAVTLTVGVQAETRITPAESKPDCPFPATVEIVPPMDQGRRVARRADRPALHRGEQADRGAAEGGSFRRTRAARSR